jgi:dihydrofolate reductase
MRELINSTYLSLDGVVEHSETWPATGGFSSEGNKIQTELLLECSAVLIGRRTYESFAHVWPNMADNPLADKMNAMPKYVASRTLKTSMSERTRT